MFPGSPRTFLCLVSNYLYFKTWTRCLKSDIKIDTGQQRAHWLLKTEGGLFLRNVRWKGLKSLARVVSWSELTVCSFHRSVRNHLRWNMRRSDSFIHSCSSQTKDAVLFSLFLPWVFLFWWRAVWVELLPRCLSLSVLVVVRRLSGTSNHSSPESCDSLGLSKQHTRSK